jgi:hypothetical protein
MRSRNSIHLIPQPEWSILTLKSAHRRGKRPSSLLCMKLRVHYLRRLLRYRNHGHAKHGGQ